MMVKMVKAVLGLVMVLGAVVGLAGPAHAAGSGIWVSGGVLYEGCRTKSFDYSVDRSWVDAGYDWSMDVILLDPRGDESTGSFLYSGANAPSGVADGYDGFYLCSYEPAGRYTVVAEIEYCGGEYYDCHTESVQTSFTMRRPYSRTSLAVNDQSASYRQRLTFTVRSRAEHPNGYYAYEYAPVTLQKRTASGWVRIARGYANENGVTRFAIRWTPRHRVAVRALTRRTSSYGRSSSTTIWIR
jgi:hypothetical protein